MGFGIKEGIMIRDAMRDVKEQQKADAFEKEYKTHLSGLQAEPDVYKPEGDYNPKAFNQARMEQLNLQLTDQTVQKGVFEHQRASIDAQFARSQALHRQAQAAMAAKDLDSELKAYELAYKNVFDGMDMELGEDRKSYTLTDKLTGEITTKTFKDSTAMTNTMRSMSDALAIAGTFAQKAMESRMERAMINADQEWTPLVNEKGAKAWTTKQYNNDTGETDVIYEIQGQRVPAEEARKLGFVAPAKEKIMAEAAAKRAAAKVAGKPKGAGVGQPHAEEKLTDFYARTYKVNRKEALRLIREDKAKGRIAQDMGDFIESEMLDPDDPEDAKKIKAKRKALQELYAPTMPKKARGIPIAAAEEEVPVDRLPDPESLRENQTAGGGKYIIKDGQWQLAK